MSLLSLIFLGGLAPIWFGIGTACQCLRLPSITGYIVAGIICGPHVLALLKPQDLVELRFVEHACLSYIALLAGAELHMGSMRKVRRQVTFTVAGITIFSWAFVFTCALLAASNAPFLAMLPRRELLAVCNLLGVLAVARSPASAIAVMKEVQGSGPYCSLVMAVVVLKDVVVFLAFSLAVKAAEQASVTAGTALNPVSAVIDPLLGVGSSIVIGALGGVIMDKCQHSSSSTHFLYRWPYLRASLPIFLSSTIYAISELALAEPLLACVTAGAMATHTSSTRSASISHHASLSGADEHETPILKMHISPAPAHLTQRPSTAALLDAKETATTSHSLGTPTTTTTTTYTKSSPPAPPLTYLLTPVSTLLFGLVGANLHIDKLLRNAGLAWLLFTVRIIGIWIGSWAGGWAGAVPGPLRERMWQGMVTQAGIAMGLTRVVVAKCKGAWGPDFEALMAGVVVGNLLVGPPLFRVAITAAGEAHLNNALSVGPNHGEHDLNQVEDGFFTTPVKGERSPAKTIPIIDLRRTDRSQSPELNL